MANKKHWIVKTWNNEASDWQEAARLETFDAAVQWAEENIGLHGDYTFENELETALQAKRAAFGTGEVIYPTADDFPAEIDHNGRHWHRTEFEYTTVETGMTNFEYTTYDTDRDIRLFIDAAGNIWNEEELGIL